MRTPLELVAACGACGLYKKCKSPKMPVSGKGERGILIIGEAPGEKEDLQNKPFVGQAGKHLETTLRRLGVEMRRDCWITNSIICRPEKNIIKDEKVIDYCRPNVFKVIEQVKPTTIILLGAQAVKSVIGHLWKPDCGGIMRWCGFQAPSQKLNSWICPTFHPSFVLRDKEQRVSQLLFEKHLEAALEKTGKPWTFIPNYHKQLDIVMEAPEAAYKIHRFIDAGRPISFDYETNMLKPDFEESEIICCSISDGARSIAYPWVGEAIEATKELITSPLKKVGQSIKFETRWSQTKLGIKVKNWEWDCMVEAHVFDNRQGVCGLDFQAFSRLGFPTWDSEIENYVTSKKPNQPNRLRELIRKEGWRPLLEYCALDSLLEFKIAELQMKEAGIKL